MVKTKREYALENDISIAVACLENAMFYARVARLREKEGVDNSVPLRLLEMDITKALATLDWQPLPNAKITYHD